MSEIFFLPLKQKYNDMDFQELPKLQELPDYKANRSEYDKYLVTVQFLLPKDIWD